MKSGRDNDTPVQSQLQDTFLGHAMRAARSEPRRGRLPVAQDANCRLIVSHRSWGVRDKCKIKVMTITPEPFAGSHFKFCIRLRFTLILLFGGHRISGKQMCIQNRKRGQDNDKKREACTCQAGTDI